MQRGSALFILFCACEFGGAETSGALNLDAFRTELHRCLDGFLHRAAETDSPLKLGCDVLGNQLRICFRLFHFHYVEDHFATLQQFCYGFSQGFELRAFASDQETRTCSKDRDAHIVAVAFDHDLGDAGMIEVLFNEFTNLQIFVEPITVIRLCGEPARTPVLVQG